jgi:hypothetical protein
VPGKLWDGGGWGGLGVVSVGDAGVGSQGGQDKEKTQDWLLGEVGVRVSGSVRGAAEA